MAIMIDADVLIADERGIFDLQGWLLAREQERFELAAITLAELWHGFERASGARKVKCRKYIENALDTFSIIPYTDMTAQIHAHIWASLVSSGKMIGYHDLIVAASAIERGSAVATFNVRHFSAVKGLKVIEPK
jgi:predicted nucleic acid-binding protein